MNPSKYDLFIQNMKTPENRINMTWFYPKICGFQDKISNTAVNDYFNHLQWPPERYSPKLLLYIHIPFCHSFCSFCACYKEIYNNWKGVNLKRFVDALDSQIRCMAMMPQFTGARPSYIQFGGGTPSVLNRNALRQIIIGIKDSFDLSELKGISFEANAIDLADPQYPAMLKELGISRVSYGVQTTNETVRRAMGIKASMEHVKKAAENIRTLGMSSFAVDLIYNLPGQNKSILHTDMQYICNELNPTFIQTYPFNQWTGSKLDKRIRKKEFGNTSTKIDELEQYRMLANELPLMGYGERILINFFGNNHLELPVGLEFACGGNGYQQAHTLAFGPSAESYLGRYCYRNISSVAEWIEHVELGWHPVYHAREVDENEMAHRLLVFFPVFGKIAKEHAFIINDYADTFDALLRYDYLKETNNTFELTDKGMEFAGNIAYEFYSNKEKLRANKTMYLSIKNKKNPFHQDSIAM